MAYSFSMPEMNFGNMFGKKAPEEEELPQSEADYNAMADAFNATNAEATAELDDRVRYEEMFDQPTIDIPTYPMAETEYGPASEPTPTETPPTAEVVAIGISLVASATTPVIKPCAL